MNGSGRRSRFVGCLLGLAAGDALGAPFEGGFLEQALWRVIGRTPDGRHRWTDDTQMTLDVAQSLISRKCVDPDDMARRFAESYRWSRGYGPGTARILKKIRRGVHWAEASKSVYRDGSFGNGGAMRAPAVGLFGASDLASLPAQARASARVTHAHPLGEEAAVLIAMATGLALSNLTAARIVSELTAQSQCEEFRRKLDIAAGWLQSTEADPASVRKRLGNGIAATESCVTALYVALRFRESPFEEMLTFVVACGGDVDTIGAMAGAIWGARNGAEALPADALRRVERIEHIADVANRLYENSAPAPAA